MTQIKVVEAPYLTKYNDRQLEPVWAEKLQKITCIEPSGVSLAVRFSLLFSPLFPPIKI